MWSQIGKITAQFGLKFELKMIIIKKKLSF